MTHYNSWSLFCIPNANRAAQLNSEENRIVSNLFSAFTKKKQLHCQNWHFVEASTCFWADQTEVVSECRMDTWLGKVPLVALWNLEMWNWKVEEQTKKKNPLAGWRYTALSVQWLFPNLGPLRWFFWVIWCFWATSPFYKPNQEREAWCWL